MTTHYLPAAFVRETYDGSRRAEVKVHENEHGKFFEPVVFRWTTPDAGANTKFALVVESPHADGPFMFATGSVIAARRLYNLDPPVFEFATGDTLDIEGVGEFTIESGGYLSHGVKLVSRS